MRIKQRGLDVISSAETGPHAISFVRFDGTWRTRWARFSFHSGEPYHTLSNYELLRNWEDALRKTMQSANTIFSIEDSY